MPAVMTINVKPIRNSDIARLYKKVENIISSQEFRNRNTQNQKGDKNQNNEDQIPGREAFYLLFVLHSHFPFKTILG